MSDETFTENLRQYAELTVDLGAGVGAGDTVYLQIGTDQAEFAHLIVEAAYARGAAEVQLWWQDDFIKRQDMLHMQEDRLFNQPPQTEAMMTYWLAHNAKRITVLSSDPDNLSGVPSQRVAGFQDGFQKVYSQLSAAISSNRISWTIVGAASPAWAQKVFPAAASPEAATQQLWDAIFKTVRIDQPEPEAAWSKHIAKLNAKAAWLNDMAFDRLHYQAPGTDLTVGLPDHHIWTAAGAENPQGDHFVPNMPTEEVFTVPDNRRIDGTVASTKPLSYAGNILEGMHFTFKNGVVTEAHADTGDETLQHLLGIRGARSLGEVSLVPDPSPISQSGLIFFNTLYDENASDHMALGQAYPFCVVNGTNMTPEELAAAGLNDADTHVDFMMGSADMNIDGITKDGKIVPIFRNGDWA
ncbi:aminopeptidase [Lacticaseibacillus daqingensis]|uniref:aminopeptidase n=1 Tax=Lacticaseibacillus daqingensis TaxID=2486014 RepID=UPI000F7B89EB|nr:aminopeptidase [Lacticaseibacillus daqingensis]